MHDAMAAPVIERFPQERLFFGAATENASRLLEGECDAAFITAIDFAKNCSELSLYRPAVLSKGASRAILLLTKPNSRTIRTVAFGAVNSGDVVLTKIILSEKYELDVAFQPSGRTINDSLRTADAVLLSGNDALHVERGGSEINLVDEWNDMTELPFVHFLCAGQRKLYSKKISAMLHSIAETAAENLDPAVVHVAAAEKVDAEEARNYLSGFTYVLDDEALAGVNEFFRYAFYLGILPDIPDITKFSAE
ncbi:MAG: hypothetical protein KGJ59_01840 [Bacteroidota bacterium]|nr:hypothetical protein [Bacteroidota bacterium]